MTSYTPGQGGVGAFPAVTLEAIELRVISNLLQSDIGPGSRDELRLMRNDIAQAMGIVPAIVPGD